MYPLATRELAQQRRELAYAQQTAFDTFGRAVLADGALTAKMKQVVAVAVAHITQSTEMRSGAAYAHASTYTGPSRASPTDQCSD
jgi:hypothetical protein